MLGSACQRQRWRSQPAQPHPSEAAVWLQGTPAWRSISLPNQTGAQRQRVASIGRGFIVEHSRVRAADFARLRPQKDRLAAAYIYIYPINHATLFLGHLQKPKSPDWVSKTSHEASLYRCVGARLSSSGRHHDLDKTILPERGMHRQLVPSGLNQLHNRGTPPDIIGGF